MVKDESIKVYFPGLNGLRFFAALAVIITHVELLKLFYGYESCWNNKFIFYLGGFGVYFFFVLSGFLITYLLIVEKQNFKTISVKQFYLRRIFRIWPLYYFIVIIGFFILPHFTQMNMSYFLKDFTQHFYIQLFLYLIILPNLAFSFYSAVPHIGQAWSIGVEEQFYIIWPWVMKKFEPTIALFLKIIIGIIFFKLLIWLYPRFFPMFDLYLPIKKFVAMSKIECMAIGSLGACILYNKEFPKLIKIIYSTRIQLISLFAIPSVIYIFPDSLNDVLHLPYSILFLIIILNVANNPSSILSLNNSVFNFLGKISYGLYMYHLIIIAIIITYVYPYWNPRTNHAIANISLYALTLFVTILIAALSYQFIEEPLIKRKQKFSKIKQA